MPNINDLINNIQGSIESLTSTLRGEADLLKGVPTYGYQNTEYKNIQSRVNSESWSKLLFPYTFSVINIKTGASSIFGDFELPLAPQSITQSEPMAISIRATQGGTSVNHGGNRYKDLSISGTTGIAPFRGAGGVDRKTGEAILQPKDLKFKSGYEVFIHLRNWFRTYYEFKSKSAAEASDFRLIFKNYKDGEFLIIELLKFDMERAAGKPFLYDYKLEFRVLSHFEFNNPTSEDGPFANIDTFIQDGLDKINVARGTFLRFQDILRQVESTYTSSVLEPLRQITLAGKAFNNIPLVAADVSTRTIVNTVSTANATLIVANETKRLLALGALGQSETLNEINQLIDRRKGTLKEQLKITERQVTTLGPVALAGFGAIALKMDSSIFPKTTLESALEDQRNSVTLPRSFYEDTIEGLIRVKQNAEDFFNLGSSDYDAIFDRTSTLNPDITKVFTAEEYDVLNGFNEAIQGIYKILSTTDLFKSNFDDKIQDIIRRFDGKITLRSNPTVKQVKLNAGQTLERLALQELGDSSRWGEIAEVNNLKPPYITQDQSSTLEGVLKPGSIVLIPVPALSGFTDLPQGAENKLTKGMSELEKSLGVDFKLDKNKDLTIGNSGDLELIAGADNLGQGILLKLSYEPGELMKYPQIGAGIVVGRKFPTLDSIRDGIVSTLLQDSRIERVSDLSLRRENSALSVSFNIKIKNVDIPIPITLKI